MKNIILTFILSCTFFASYTQNKYGNEWIKKDQAYLKIKISEKGVFKISYSQLQAQGFLNANPNPKNFQIYYLGEEIFLNVTGEQDGTFDINDEIQFYASLDNGKFDSPLYKIDEQPNGEISLFEDDAYYFLTISKSDFGKRYTNTQLNSNGLSPEQYIIYTSSLNFNDSYYPGTYVLDVMTFSDYIEGEGYLGNTFSIGTSQIKSILTPNFFNTLNYKTNIQSYVAGRSNASSTNPQGNNHHLNISIGNITIKDTLYRGYKTVRINHPINNINLNQTTDLKFTSINDVGAVTDFQAIGYARISYSRSLDAQNYTSLPFKLNSNNSVCLLNFLNTSNWSNTKIVNPTIGKSYNSIQTGNTTSILVENSKDELLVYNDLSIKNVTLENVIFNYIDASNYASKMLLITHTSLISSVNDLSAYKRSKGISNSIITTDQIYNQFSYGIHHPSGIRNLARYLIEQGSIKPEYLFLLGKGFEIPKNNLTNDLVPTMGFPPSDVNFTSKIIDNNLAPALATGRLPAKTNQEVTDYLNKLKLYDTQPNELWRKSIINIAGGANNFEDNSFSQSLNNFSAIASRDLFGSKTTSYFKRVSDPITTGLVDQINSSIESGASLLTYLGHGSTISTAVSIGNPNNINNKNKLLFYYINGCSTGNAFATTSLGENYIFQKEKGAIGWIGTSSEGVASYLTGFGNQFYQNSFKSNYGKSVAQNLATSIRSYANENDALNKIHSQQFIFLGDPSLTFYSPEKPDYEVKNENISLSEPNITANSANFGLKIIVKNNGKAIVNDLKVFVSRTLNDNSIINYPIQIFKPVFNTDTLNFIIDNNISNAAGTNKFSIIIDPNNEIDEFNEQNNNINYEYFLPSNGITIIEPLNYSIVSVSNPELKVGANNLFTKNASYLFEIDTLISFNSNWKKISGPINSNLFSKWNPGNVLENNKIYYWRAKLDVNLQNGGDWQTGSFTYISNENEGYNQGHYQQFGTLNLTNLVLKDKKFEFAKTAYPIFVQTRGNNAPTNTERRLRVSISVGALSFNSSEFRGLAIAAFNPINSRNLYSYPSQFNFSNNGVTKTGQFFFDTNNPAHLDSLATYLSNIPEGFFVVGLSGVDFSGKNLPANIKNYLSSLGLIQFEKVNNGEPYIFVSEKGNLTSSLLKEVTADYSSSILASSQYISLNTDLLNNFNAGVYQSDKIGPAISWDKVFFNFKSNSNDNIIHSVIGVEGNGTETVLKNNISSNSVIISDINAVKYPFIKLKSSVNDDIDKTAAELLSWKVLFKGFSEVSFNPEMLNLFYANELNEGDSLKLSSAINNIKTTASDSLFIRYKITKTNRTTETGLVGKYSLLSKGENHKFNFKFPTVGLVGDNILQLTLESKGNNDLLNFNNIISYPFKVIKDIKNPLVDILFDGKHIINGEIVSPKPNINITINDDNKYLLLNDTNLVEVFIRRQDGELKRVSFSSNKILIQKTATAENNTISYSYQPDLLDDGVYTLSIKAKDKSGNSIITDFSVEFEVISEQTITNVLPYPNPVVNSTRFVFQITGLKVPDKMRIQISTSNGKIVRVINKAELGNLKIGNNISDFIWDGTDTFGDRLANGVYFYQVFVENNDGSNIEKRNNQSDKYFKKNIGKIYLMK
jgi:hypothetical protein